MEDGPSWSQRSAELCCLPCAALISELCSWHALHWCKHVHFCSLPAVHQPRKNFPAASAGRKAVRRRGKGGGLNSTPPADSSAVVGGSAGGCSPYLHPTSIPQPGCAAVCVI